MTGFNLSCPLPEGDFDRVTLGHGSGGQLTRQLLDDGVFSLFDNVELQKKDDSAILELQGPLAMSTDSYVVTPLFFSGGNIGDLAMHGTLNDLAMVGAEAKAISLAFILEEGFPFADLKKILLTIAMISKASGVPVVTGDTKVVEKGKGDGIFINTTGIGKIHPKAKLSINRIQPEDAILVSGFIGDHGMALLSQREGLEFDSPIKSDSYNLSPLVSKLLDEFGESIHFMRDATRGGVASVLNEIVEGKDFGIELEQENIPVREATASACELLGLDPLYVANEGCFVAFIDSKKAPSISQFIKTEEPNLSPSIIGKNSLGTPGKVLVQSPLGGKRVVSLLPGEQLPRIC